MRALETLGAMVIGLAAFGVAATTLPLDQLKAQFRRPSGLPVVSGNEPNEARLNLGRALFFEPLLSGTGTISCATCHSPVSAWTDRVAKPINDVGQHMPRRSPPILNLAWADSFLWDGRTESLDSQAVGPMTNPHLMKQPLERMIERLDKIAGYRDMFERAYPGEGISGATMAKAIAVFERSIVSGRARFDDWIDGKDGALSAEEISGFMLFTGKGQRVRCHQGWNFTDGSFHDIGLPDTSDVGRGRLFPTTSRCSSHSRRRRGPRGAGSRGCWRDRTRRAD